MTEKYETFQERYEADYAKGYRLGRIQASRKIIIRFLKHHGKPSKRLIHKINREVDGRIMFRIMDLVWNHSVAVEALDDIYDTLIPTKEDGHYDEDYQ